MIQMRAARVALRLGMGETLPPISGGCGMFKRFPIRIFALLFAPIRRLILGWNSARPEVPGSFKSYLFLSVEVERLALWFPALVTSAMIRRARYLR